jgi:hypothetical protein
MKYRKFSESQLLEVTLTTGVVNEAPYVQRTPNTGNNGVGQPAIPTENFMLLEENGYLGIFKMSAAVMEAKPEHIRHTVLTKLRMPHLEDMPTYVQRFAHEIRRKPQSRDTESRETDLDLDWISADARIQGTRNQWMPKERLVVNNNCNTDGTNYDNGGACAMQSKKWTNVPSSEKNHVRTGGPHGEGNFEYRIKYDIVPTDDAYMMPPITMASGQVPRMEAVMDCTTVRFSQVGVTKASLPPARDS